MEMIFKEVVKDDPLRTRDIGGRGMEEGLPVPVPAYALIESCTFL